ncbi:MAG: hypothetical protein ACFFD2_12510 [Promethearchaeota archaeon]
MFEEKNIRIEIYLDVKIKSSNKGNELICMIGNNEFTRKTLTEIIDFFRDLNIVEINENYFELRDNDKSLTISAFELCKDEIISDVALKLQESIIFDEFSNPYS